jgi:hypothetical protein
VRATGGTAERGSGVIGTTFGVGVFLVLLMFSAHLLLNLWVTSTVEATAHDAALDVALSGALPGRRRAVEDAAIARARASLGRYADRVDLEFEPAGPHRVALRVRAPEVRLLPPIAADVFRLGGLDRRIVVEDEAPR